MYYNTNDTHIILFEENSIQLSRKDRCALYKHKNNLLLHSIRFKYPFQISNPLYIWHMLFKLCNQIFGKSFFSICHTEVLKNLTVHLILL